MVGVLGEIGSKAVLIERSLIISSDFDSDTREQGEGSLEPQSRTARAQAVTVYSYSSESLGGVGVERLDAIQIR